MESNKKKELLINLLCIFILISTPAVYLMEAENTLANWIKFIYTPLLVVLDIIYILFPLLLLIFIGLSIFLLYKRIKKETVSQMLLNIWSLSFALTYIVIVIIDANVPYRIWGILDYFCLR